MRRRASAAALALLLPWAAWTAPELPSIDATVLRHDPAQSMAEVNKGSADGVVAGMEFTVYGRGGIVELPLTGETVVRAREPIGTLLVRSTEPHRSLCEVALREGVEENIESLHAIGLPVRTQENIAPQIRSFAADPAPDAAGCAQGAEILLRVDATDVDGDRILYQWSAEAGRLSWQRSALPFVRWTAPLQQGPQTLAVEARDARGGTMRMELALPVGGPGAPTTPYRVQRTVLGPQRPYDAARDVTCDDEGNLYVADPRRRRIHKYRVSEGDFTSFGQEGDAEGQLRQPSRLAFARGEIAVLDTERRRVLRYNPRGEFIREVCADALGNGQLQTPVDLAVSPRGEIYVLDAATGDVRVFAPTGEFVLRFGNRGTGPGAFEQPVAIDCDLNGNVYVLDAARKSVSSFDPSHRFRRSYPVAGGTDLCAGPLGQSIYVLGPGTLDRIPIDSDATDPDFARAWGGNPDWTRPAPPPAPASVTCDPLGRIWVSDEARDFPSLRRYRADGTFDRQHGGDPIQDPQIATCGGDGLCYVLDGRTGLISGLTPDGWTVHRFGGRGRNEPQFLQDPKGIVARGEDVFVLDAGACRIKQYARGRFVREFGARGTEPGEMEKPRALCADRDGGLAILEGRRGGDLILRFDAAAQFRAELRGDGPREAALRRDARLIATTTDGRLLVVQARPPYIHVLNPLGEPEPNGNWGAGGRGTEPGTFRSIAAIEPDPSGGTVWIADGEAGTCQRCRILPDERGSMHLFTVDRATLGAAARDLAVDEFGRLFVLTEDRRILLLAP